MSFDFNNVNVDSPNLSDFINLYTFDISLKFSGYLNNDVIKVLTELYTLLKNSNPCIVKFDILDLGYAFFRIRITKSQDLFNLVILIYKASQQHVSEIHVRNMQGKPVLINELDYKEFNQNFSSIYQSVNFYDISIKNMYNDHINCTKRYVKFFRATIYNLNLRKGCTSNYIDDLYNNKCKILKINYI